MSLETSTDNGIILHNCGVGGAKYGSILYENLFMPQLHALKPDLVIVDFGTNDFLYDDSMKTNLVNQVIDVVSFIRSASPNTSIILTSTMDMYHKGHNVASSEIFSDSVRMIAKKFHCGFYDWYWISGGRMMMQKWNEAGLGRNDHIHLTKAGYTLKGHLFCEAMKNTLAAYDKSPEMDSLTFFMDSIRVQEHRLIADSVAASPDIYGSLIRHTVKHGESMSIIAKKYHVTITNLKSWNDLRTSHVRVGQQLVIYQKKKITPADSTKTNSPGTKPAGSKPSPKPAVHHTTGTVHHGTTNHPATKTSSSPKPHLAKKPH